MVEERKTIAFHSRLSEIKGGHFGSSESPPASRFNWNCHLSTSPKCDSTALPLELALSVPTENKVEMTFQAVAQSHR
jgi:hypothetical protein